MSVYNLGNKIHYTEGKILTAAPALPVKADGDFFVVLGNTTITSIDSLGKGMQILLSFNEALTIEHHGIDLILPNGVDIITAQFDEAKFVEYATGHWICTSYSRAAFTAGGNAVDGIGFGATVIAPTAGAVTVSLDELYTSYSTNGSGNIYASLADGKDGQLKIIKMDTFNTDAIVITPANYYDGTSIRLDSNGEYVELIFANGAWRTLGITGVIS